MDKERILALSRKDNKNSDLVMIDTETKGAGIACITSLALCIVFGVMEKVILNRPCYGYYCIFTAYAAVDLIYKSVKLGDKKYKVLAALWSAAAIFSLALYIFSLYRQARR